MPTVVLRPQVKLFVVLFVERSGSTFLRSALHSHPEVVSLGEEFAVLKDKGHGAAEQMAWARRFWNPPLIGTKRALGFKTKIMDILDPEGFAQLLHAKRCRIIQLHRRNTVKAAISTINAKRLHEASGTWNLLREEDRQPPTAIDPEELDRLLRLREQWDRDLEAYAARLDLPKLALTYEELLLDENAFLQRVFNFLEVKPGPVRPRTLKNTSDNLREAILNFDELRARYAHTRYAPMFDEVLA